jgi:Glycosyl transferase 4-like domain
MPRCLILAPFPVIVPRHGGQLRAAGLARALSRLGWQVDTAGIYHAYSFPAEERGTHDIVCDDPEVMRVAAADPLFHDLHVATGAASDHRVVDRLRMLLTQSRPDVVQIERPWSWLVLRAALPDVGRPKIVYSSHDVESHSRSPLLRLNLNLKRPGTDRLMDLTRLLETDLAREADLTISISDFDRAQIAGSTGRAVAYVPPVSDLAVQYRPPRALLTRSAGDGGCRYAALMGSDHSPNIEGFFAMFPDGLGFLTQDEQIWTAGSLGAALRADPRYRDFLSVNDARFRDLSFLPEAGEASFFAAARCVIIPVLIGSGAATRIAGALASGCPVITTSHAMEGHGPLLHDLLDRGVYVADTPRDFHNLMRRASRDGLPACPPEVRDRVNPARMTERLAPLFAGLLR